MREDQVLAASVQVEGRAEIFHGHRGALDVPPGPAPSPRAVPGGLAGLRGFPEREITGVALALVHLDAGARQQLVEVLARQPPAWREAADREVEAAPDRVGLVGGPPTRHGLDHLRPG